MIERVKDDLYVRTKLVELRIRPGEIIVTRLFSCHIHQPLVLFTIQNELTPSAPNKIKLTQNTIAFDTCSGIHGNIRTNERDALLMQVSCYDSRVGIMFPTGSNNCVFADETKAIDKRFTTIAHYRRKSNDPTQKQLSLPMLHMITENASLTTTSQRIESVEFCHFIYDHLPYFNIVASDELDIAMRSFNSQRSAISHFYQRHGHIAPLPITENLNLFQMQKSLFTNCSISVPADISKIKEAAQKAQSRLEEKKITNCIVGSLAAAMHKPEFAAQDVDIVVDSLNMAKAAFKDQQTSGIKWQTCSFRTTIDNIQIDIAELSEFDWDEVVKVRGLKVLSARGLVIMKLMGEFERNLMQPNYDVFQVKNQETICALFDNAQYTYPFFRRFLQLKSQERFKQLKLLMEGATWDFSTLTVTFPLHANAYQKKAQTFVPIINHGTPTAGKIWIGKQISTADWLALNGHEENCIVENSSIASIVHVPIVENAGVMVCQNA
jgi:hypothetical protein